MLLEKAWHSLIWLWSPEQTFGVADGYEMIIVRLVSLEPLNKFQLTEYFHTDSHASSPAPVGGHGV